MLSPDVMATLQQVLTPTYHIDLWIGLARADARKLAEPNHYPALSNLELHARIKARSVPFERVEVIEIPPIRMPVPG